MGDPRLARTPAERRADEILDAMPEADWDALVSALAGLVLSAARSGRRWRSISGPMPDDPTERREVPYERR